VTSKDKWPRVGGGGGRGLKIPKRFALFLLAGVAWGLWVNRNKMTIERSFPRDPLQVLCTGIAFFAEMAATIEAS